MKKPYRKPVVRSKRRAAKEDYEVRACPVAEAKQGHTGAIYRATNWTRIGERRGDPVWLDKAGRQVSRKAGPRSRTSAEMRALGYERQAPLPKVKFVFPRG